MELHQLDPYPILEDKPPLDINEHAILRRLDSIIVFYGETNERNERNFSRNVDQIISQLEIYDQLCYVRNIVSGQKHSNEAMKLVREIIDSPSFGEV